VVVDEFAFCALACCAITKSKTMMVVLLIMCCPRLFANLTLALDVSQLVHCLKPGYATS
jgi:hypothetical protein